MSPNKPRELERPKLAEELREIYVRPLLIVTAPSGYGKTTLVRNALQREENLNTIWFSLGRREVDEVWVWNRLCDRCREVKPDLAEKLRELELPRTPQETNRLIGLLRDEIQNPICLVLDDFQECSSLTINRLLTDIVYEEIANLHIVLISRTYPDLPYEEMYLRGYCTTINQTSLALSREETDEIFRINSVALAPEELEKVYEYTDGWISAVYLSLMEYQRIGRLGHFTSSAHLLKTAIFDKLSVPLRELCMKMSLFESFTAESAAYTAEMDISSVTLLEMVEQFGFMRYDAASERFTMHAMLQALAMGELERRGMDKARLFYRAGEWCERSGDYVQAVIYYRNSGKREDVFRLLSGKYHNEIAEAAPGIVRDIFLDTPPEVKAEYPVAWCCYIYNSITWEDNEWSEHLYQEAKASFLKRYDMDGSGCKLKGEMLIIRAALQYNDLEKMTASLREAYELLEHNPSGIFRQTLLTYGAPYMTMCYYNSPGGLKHIVELEKEYAKYHTRLVGRGDGDWDDLFDAEYAMITGNLEEAYRLAVRVGEKAVCRKQSCVVISSYYIQCRCLIYFGRCQEFEDRMKEFGDQVKDNIRSILITDYELAISYLYACIGRKELVAGWVRSFDLERCGRVVRSSRSGCITYGMLLCRTEQWRLLDNIADQAMVPYENTKHSYAVIRGCIYKAIAAWHLGETERARNYLRRAVSMAEEDEVRFPFIENSTELSPIMEGMQSRFCSSLQPYFRQYQRSLKLFAQKTRKVELTQREREMMTLVREGRRNVEISRELNIALVTVEKSLTNIYRKLNVSNRAAAIAKLDGTV